jgi:hypothetical protein
LPRNGEDNSFYGRRHTAATREMPSLQAMERCIPSIGEYGPDWTEELRAQIMSRDQGCCQLCGAAEALQVHHVDLNRANSEPRNLLTLCASCHLGYHGRGEQIDEMVAAHATMLERERLNVGSAP